MEEKIHTLKSLLPSHSIYEHLIELGKQLPSLPEDKKRKEHLVPGCQSQVWLYTKVEKGKLYLKGDSDALISAGMVYILLFIYHEQPLETILQSTFNPFKELGLEKALSMQRVSGGNQMLLFIKKKALQALTHS